MTPETVLMVGARRAAADDLSELERMYAALSDEQFAIREIWPDADGLPRPVGVALETLVDSAGATVVIGLIDNVPVGFLVALEEPLQAPREGDRIGSIRLIFTDHEARGVGVGGAMLSVAEQELRERGMHLFDARVSPGHRLAKNFFESHGFKARSITMHRADEVGEA